MLLQSLRTWTVTGRPTIRKMRVLLRVELEYAFLVLYALQNQHLLSKGTKYFFNRSAGFFILPRHHTPFCVAVAHVTRLFRHDGFRFGQQSWLWGAVAHKSLWRALRKWSRMWVCLRRCALWSKRVRTAAAAAAAAPHFYKTQVMPSDYLMNHAKINR